jgi:hypothetical protein
MILVHPVVHREPCAPCLLVGEGLNWPVSKTIAPGSTPGSPATQKPANCGLLVALGRNLQLTLWSLRPEAVRMDPLESVPEGDLCPLEFLEYLGERALGFQVAPT